MSKPLAVKNWSTFQHFKDRNPPWVKLHKTIIDDRDINVISDCAFRVLVFCWLLASEDKDKSGKLPDIDTIAFRTRIDKSKIIKALQELGNFIISDDINAISKRYQSDVPETETETETEGEADKVTSGKPKNKRRMIKLADESVWLEEIKTIYKPLGVDVDTQLVKAKAWLLTPRGKGRKFTQQFFVNWLSRVDVEIKTETTPPTTTLKPGDTPLFTGNFEPYTG